MVRGAALELEAVRFGYGHDLVLQELSVRLEAGEMAALLGRNGAGKSTLLSLVSGVRAPSAGTIRLDGTPLDAIPPRRRAQQVALVPQSPAVPFSFTVREWVSLGRTPYLSPWRGERDADRRVVAEALEAANVEGLADRLVGEVSGGERQRAALAQALAQEPRLLLLDEATAHLDLRHQLDLLRLVRRLNQEHGLTVLAAIHDVNLAALWFDRLLLLHEGRILADGPPDEVLRPELLETAFGCRAEVLRHPTEGVPLVALLKAEG